MTITERKQKIQEILTSDLTPKDKVKAIQDFIESEKQAEISLETSVEKIAQSLEAPQPTYIPVLRGDKGEKGDSIKGDKGDPGKDGKNGKDGKKGQDGKDASLNPLDVVPLVLEQLPPVKDVILDSGEQIVDKINALPTNDEEKKIDALHIKNLPKEVQKHTFAVQRNLAWFDETTLVVDNPTQIKFQGAGVQISQDSTGALIVTISGSAGNESNGEILTDTGDHTNFTFAHIPSIGGVRNVWIKETGQLLTVTSDYTIAGSTLTATRIMQDGDGNNFTLISNYTY